jgi:hypothetical protein
MKSLLESPKVLSSSQDCLPRLRKELASLTVPYLRLDSEKKKIREGEKKRIRSTHEDLLSILPASFSSSLSQSPATWRREGEGSTSEQNGSCFAPSSLSQLFLFSPHFSTRADTKETRQHLVTTPHPLTTKMLQMLNRKMLLFRPSSKELTTSSHTASRRTSVPPTL